MNTSDITKSKPRYNMWLNSAWIVQNAWRVQYPENEKNGQGRNESKSRLIAGNCGRAGFCAADGAPRRQPDIAVKLQQDEKDENKVDKYIIFEYNFEKIYIKKHPDSG